MRPEEFEQLAAWFDLHVQTTLGEARDTALEGKYAHCRRVAAECRGIAEALGWPEAEVRLGEAAGLLHDVGRFFQLKAHGSLDDQATLDHGELGWKILAEDPAVPALEPAVRDRLLTAVRYHNRREIPGATAAEALPFLQLVRDGDKLDIFSVYCAEMRRDGGATFKRLWPDLRDGRDINPVLLEEYRAGRNCSYRNVRNLADFTMVLLSWSFALNFQPSYARLEQRGLLAALSECMPRQAELQALAEEARAYVGRRAAAV